MENKTIENMVFKNWLLALAVATFVGVFSLVTGAPLRELPFEPAIYIFFEALFAVALVLSIYKKRYFACVVCVAILILNGYLAFVVVPGLNNEVFSTVG